MIYSGPSLVPIERPRCHRCFGRMSLTRIMPDRPGFDVRTFECGQCHHTQIVSVEIDPMKSNRLGWLAGELKPPQ